jgi:hypothetical protein
MAVSKAAKGGCVEPPWFDNTNNTRRRASILLRHNNELITLWLRRIFHKFSEVEPPWFNNANNAFTLQARTMTRVNPSFFLFPAKTLCANTVLTKLSSAQLPINLPNISCKTNTKKV